MKNLKNPILPFLIIISLFSSCSTTDSDLNNTDPGLFSANSFDATVDGARIDWTESIDIDDDPVTYAIILEGEEVASGLTNKTYIFSGLEPETIYAGYVEARDGRGGTSIAEFSFVTEPEVIIFIVQASWWIKDQYPEGTGLRTALRSGFIIPYYEDATQYQIEILDYGVGPTRVWSDDVGKTFTWTNDFQSTPIGPVYVNQTEPGDYSAALTATSINTLSSGYNDRIVFYNSVYGEARVTVVISNK